MPKFTCRSCIYFRECGENMRTVPCAGRITKKQKSLEDNKPKKKNWHSIKKW